MSRIERLLAKLQAFYGRLPAPPRDPFTVFVREVLSVHSTPAKRDAAIDANPRSAVARAVAGFTERGVRAMLVAVPPVTHSTRDKSGFIPTLIAVAREKFPPAHGNCTSENSS